LFSSIPTLEVSPFKTFSKSGSFPMREHLLPLYPACPFGAFPSRFEIDSFFFLSLPPSFSHPLRALPRFFPPSSPTLLPSLGLKELRLFFARSLWQRFFFSFLVQPLSFRVHRPIPSPNPNSPPLFETMSCFFRVITFLFSREAFSGFASFFPPSRSDACPSYDQNRPFFDRRGPSLLPPAKPPVFFCLIPFFPPFRRRFFHAADTLFSEMERAPLIKETTSKLFLLWRFKLSVRF